MPTALITGASRGLGEALARQLARDAWTLIIDAREEAPLVTADVALQAALRKRWPQFGVVALAEAPG